MRARSQKSGVVEEAPDRCREAEDLAEPPERVSGLIPKGDVDGQRRMLEAFGPHFLWDAFVT